MYAEIILASKCEVDVRFGFEFQPKPVSDESCSRPTDKLLLLSGCSTTMREARLKGLSLGCRGKKKPKINVFTAKCNCNRFH